MMISAKMEVYGSSFIVLFRFVIFSRWLKSISFI